MKRIKKYDDVPFASWVSEFISSASKKLKIYLFIRDRIILIILSESDHRFIGLA
jgi:hypothetical protein